MPASVTKPWVRSPRDAHEWVSFEDEHEARRWIFDITFLASRWACLFGHGCQGVLTGPAPELEQGCCSYGAHFTDDQDVARVEAAASTLAEEQWQFARRGRRYGCVVRGPDGALVTRMVKGACIFLNRPGFAGGAGCALHRGAQEAGVPHHRLKPDVCWQLPLRREETTDEQGWVTTTITQWDRRHWGAGGNEFAWWCTEAPEAFSGSRPVWESMAAELTEIAGPEVYERLVAYIDERGSLGTPLPHPTLRGETTLRASSR